jgi:hypothetical protein
MTTPVLTPLRFDAPLLNPSPNGLYAATAWTEIGPDEPSRHLTGVEVSLDRLCGHTGCNQLRRKVCIDICRLDLR